MQRTFMSYERCRLNEIKFPVVRISRADISIKCSLLATRHFLRGLPKRACIAALNYRKK